MIESTDQHLSIKFKQDGGTQEVVVTSVYAKCDATQRGELWEALQQVAEGNNLPWLVGGDFNVILNQKEKLWGLNDMGFSGSKYTWWNGRTGEACIYERLDRVLCNQMLLDILPSCEVTHLIRHGSDHDPLHVECRDEGQNVKKSFKFLNFWTNHRDVFKVVE